LKDGTTPRIFEKKSTTRNSKSNLRSYKKIPEYPPVGDSSPQMGDSVDRGTLLGISARRESNYSGLKVDHIVKNNKTRKSMEDIVVMEASQEEKLSSKDSRFRKSGSRL